MPSVWDSYSYASAGSCAAEVALRQFRPGESGAEPVERGVPTLERPPARDFTAGPLDPAPGGRPS